MYTVDRNIPMPESRKKTEGPTYKPSKALDEIAEFIQTLSVGDSFLMPQGTSIQEKLAQIRNVGKRYGMFFRAKRESVIIEGRKKCLGNRVWQVQ